MKKTKLAGRVLVTGGAGYIGRATVEVLQTEGFDPFVVDNFSTSDRRRLKGVNFAPLDLCDYKKTLATVKKHGPFEGVFHFAAKAVVPDSCKNPELYLRHNLESTLNVAQAAIETGCKLFVNSSSCAVYGVPHSLPITESSPLNPISPYGESKVLTERILGQLARYRGLKVLNLRYFNPAGALGEWGEDHDPEPHLIPNLVRSALKKKPVIIYGDDYETEDGSCVRDFIHVADLAEAHLRAFRFLKQAKGEFPDALNLGTGSGISVKQAIAATEKVFGISVKRIVKPRRAGDPPRLYADSSLSRKIFGWSATRTVEMMIGSQRDWEVSRKKR